jgi:hypothetical protein
MARYHWGCHICCEYLGVYRAYLSKFGSSWLFANFFCKSELAYFSIVEPGGAVSEGCIWPTLIGHQEVAHRPAIQLAALGAVWFRGYPLGDGDIPNHPVRDSHFSVWLKIWNVVDVSQFYVWLVERKVVRLLVVTFCHKVVRLPHICNISHFKRKKHHVKSFTHNWHCFFQ